MTPNIFPLIVGNWKMNGLRASLEHVKVVVDALSLFDKFVDVVICPPATLVYLAAQLCKGSSLLIGGQDCHKNEFGAHTGDISAKMLVDCGADFVIIGHSERRFHYQETDDIICSKIKTVCFSGLKPILCIGESADEYSCGKTYQVLQRQLEYSLPDDIEAADLVVAYEPIWAIGTGCVPSLDNLEEVHTFIRSILVSRFSDIGQKIRILYGGSVNANNSSQFISVNNLDGLLVGGASLKSSSFLDIIKSFRDFSPN
ncbi:Triosephosphate isomerase [Liberibacter crescens BT-1]|uniref:Triosephosphate isomerase n=1 Tax=Liberibacter crescens (strain BT-1) TaxID=1215343 RepID=L0EUW7_LIBCB|nr:triose-phosphate isomerase [Liberibacter crescens]AGA64453.1 Triosephosphate isomerase [Liberibacter crescens BT-1]AMC12628.1 triosephosphate isomerase [Liberibacter crescens]